MTAPPQLAALTGIRGVAAWLVVLYHVRLSLAALLPAPAIAALSKGYLAVDLFFMLSGFVLWYNYGGALRRDGFAAAPGFLWRRFARIWPLHVAILGGFTALVAVFAASGRSVAGYPLAELPLHLLLVQNWGFTAALTWNHPAWSISTEFAAYLLFPLVVCATRRWTLPLAAQATLLIGLACLLHAAFAVNGYTMLGDAIPTMGLWRCLAEFAMGTVVCALWWRWRDSVTAERLTWIGAGLTLGAGWLLGLPETAFVPAALAAALLALALSRGAVARIFAARPLVILGEISYSTYLAHALLFIVFKLGFVDASLQLGWAGLAGYLVLVLGASFVLHRGVEKPAQRRLNAWHEQPRREPEPALSR